VLRIDHVVLGGWLGCFGQDCLRELVDNLVEEFPLKLHIQEMNDSGRGE